jgi:hypothetical protein
VNIVYIHQYYRFGPDGGPVRSWYISQALAKAGHKVTILGSHKGKQILERTDGLVRVVLFPVAYSNSFGFIQRLFSWIKFVWYCRRWLKTKVFELAYLSSTPLTVAWLSFFFKKRGIPYCFEVRDLWPEIPVWMGIVPGVVGRMISYFMSSVYSDAFSVICLAKPVKEYLSKHYRLSEEPLLISNFSDTDFYRQSRQDNDKQLQLVYSGALGDSAGIYELEMLKDLIKKEDLNMHLHIAGEGKWQETFSQNEDEHHFSYHGFLNREEIKALLNTCHLGLVLFKQSEVFNFNSPNKYFDYLAAGLPIASNLKNSWFLKEAESHSCGFHLDFQNQDKLLGQLKLIRESLISRETSKHALELSKQYQPEKQLRPLIEKLAKVYT